MTIVKYLFRFIFFGLAFGAHVPGYAETSTISAFHNCKDEYNSAYAYKGGYKAGPGGSSVIVCPLNIATDLVKNRLNSVYARVQRANLTAIATPSCTFTIYGSITGTAYSGLPTYAKNHSKGQSLALGIPAIGNFYDMIWGYASVSCILPPGDVFYGVQYSQTVFN